MRPAYVDTPNPGEMARFGDYMARWIGTGRSFSQVSFSTSGQISQHGRKASIWAQ